MEFYQMAGGGTYEVTREHFDRLIKRYKEYVELYKYFNKGSAVGVTPFAVFYWRMTYHVKYNDPQRETTLRS